MNTMQDYEEILGDRREFDEPRPQNSHRRLYQILAGVQLISVSIVTACAMYAAGYFG